MHRAIASTARPCARSAPTPLRRVRHHLPFGVLLLAAAGVVEVGTAFEIGLIGFYGFCAARLAGESTWRALLYATAIALVGAFLVALKGAAAGQRHNPMRVISGRPAGVMLAA